MGHMEHVDNRKRAAAEDETYPPFFGERESDNAKNSFISGFFQTLGAGAATGLFALLGVVAHALLSGSAKGRADS